MNLSTIDSRIVTNSYIFNLFPLIVAKVPGEKDKALQIYQEALEKHPESPYLQELKQRISP